ncbi:MAG: ferrous iron transport protein B [Clostridia bacterium]|nr:ferrous iron transport protein B [Clostridia bacterium]
MNDRASKQRPPEPPRLSALSPGERGRVAALCGGGPMRRRLQDLGFVPGSEVECLGRGPGGQPTAYLVRGAAIALREEDAGRVELEEIRPPAPPRRWTVALAGNPNVGKSTVFNRLTGLHQHTGNWPGKTVASARGLCRRTEGEFELVDLPGTYSLLAHSAEEEVARDYLCFERPQAVVVVCDAGCLERSLGLVLQVAEITPRIVLCLNLMDEAERRGIVPDVARLQQRLRLPVVPTAARSGEGMEALLAAVRRVAEEEPAGPPLPVYGEEIEAAVSALLPTVAALSDAGIPPRWAALRLLLGDLALEEGLCERGLWTAAETEQLHRQRAELAAQGLDPITLHDRVARSLTDACDRLADGVVRRPAGDAGGWHRRLDRLLTSPATGIPVMLLLLGLVLWLTVWGANLPSSLLFSLFARLGQWLETGLAALALPPFVSGLLVDGIYRVTTWVVAVMLPPMAIFFPLFTLLEDFGYLPRVAFALDGCFRCAHACGKQALTTLMGLGCNAVGVTGCRIIDSPRERLIAILTNAMVPCNGRFPTLIALISLYFAGSGPLGSLRAAAMLLLVLLLGVGMTLLSARLLSATVLKGLPSSFALELPPYRPPQVGRVLVRSLIDRTLFVLGRAVAVAAPAGALIYLLSHLGEGTLPGVLAAALDPLGRLLGMDGAILLAFLLGFPANELVLPLLLMIYSGGGTLQEVGSLPALGTVLAANGWTAATALCVMVFSLLHFPCSTTCLTIYKETGSLKWTALAVLLPTLCGAGLCLGIAAVLG